MRKVITKGKSAIRESQVEVRKNHRTIVSLKTTQDTKANRTESGQKQQPAREEEGAYLELHPLTETGLWDVDHVCNCSLI